MFVKQLFGNNSTVIYNTTWMKPFMFYLNIKLQIVLLMLLLFFVVDKIKYSA